MNRDLVARVWELVAHRARGAPLSVVHVCEAAVPVVGVDGVGLTVTAGHAARESIHATDRIAGDLEEWQLTLGEGPCVDTAAEGGPVLVPELDRASYAARWPAFTPAGIRSGAAALFAFPLRLGAIQVGTMTYYRASPGPLNQLELAHALVFADTAALIVLDGDASGPAGTARTASGETGLHEAEIHQATGILMVQLDLNAAAAFARLRAYAYAHDRRLGEVARDVVAHRLRFDVDPPGGTGQIDSADPDARSE